MSGPAVTRIRQLDTHRLIPSKHGEDAESVLVRIAGDRDRLLGVLDLDRATNDRLLAEQDRLQGIGIDEQVFGVPNHRVVNAAFVHAHPLGSRFNGPDRGAWQAGFELETSLAEVAWHKSVELAEVDWMEERATYDDYLADFGGEFHDIRGDARFERCLDPGSYAESQALAEHLLGEGSSGIIHPGMRRSGGVCLACFRPALVANVRRSARYRLTWAGSPEPEIDFEHSYL